MSGIAIDVHINLVEVHERTPSMLPSLFSLARYKATAPTYMPWPRHLSGMPMGKCPGSAKVLEVGRV